MPVTPQTGPVPAQPVPAQPNVPAFAEDISPGQTVGAVPTLADYQRHFGTYRAPNGLVYQGSVVVAHGGGVPLDHPGMRDGEDGPGWVTQGSVELTGDYPAPADLVEQAAAGEKARKDAQAS